MSTSHRPRHRPPPAPVARAPRLPARRPAAAGLAAALSGLCSLPGPAAAAAAAAAADTSGSPVAIDRRTEATDLFPELSINLENPLARVLSLPVQFLYEGDAGPLEDGHAVTARFTPGVPVPLGDAWHVISYSNFGWVTQENVTRSGSLEGLTDWNQTFFFSPDRPVYRGAFWGAGPALVVPTATVDELGSEKFSLGPSIGIFHQSDHWTAGVLANHLWSVAGEGGRDDVNTSLLQGHLSFTGPASVTVSLNSPTRYDWSAGRWLVPVDAGISRLFLFGRRPVKIGAGARYYATRAPGGSEWGLFLRVNLPFRNPWRRAGE